VILDSLHLYATDRQLELCKEFAVACYKLRKEVYSRRDQNNPNQIIKQIGMSKLYEFMIYNYFTDNLPEFISISRPSLELYVVPSFDADIQLTMDGQTMNVNIKSQEGDSWAKFGYSWVFQREDKLFKEKKSELLVLGTTAFTNGRILGLGFVEEFIPHIGGMGVEMLNKTKLAIYHDPKFECFKPSRKPLIDFILE
jgi:hypothetical protein